MSAFSTLLALINAQIKTNGQKAITGAKLNGVLVQMVNELGSGYQFIDIATPATDPGTPDENVWYIASQAGTYTNFGGIIVNENEVCALVWNGSWTKKVSGAATAAQVNQLGQQMKTGATIPFLVSNGRFYVEETNVSGGKIYINWTQTLQYIDPRNGTVNLLGTFSDALSAAGLSATTSPNGKTCLEVSSALVIDLATNKIALKNVGDLLLSDILIVASVAGKVAKGCDEVLYATICEAGNIAIKNNNLFRYFNDATNTKSFGRIIKDSYDITITSTLTHSAYESNMILTNKGESAASSGYNIKTYDVSSVNDSTPLLITGRQGGSGSAVAAAYDASGNVIDVYILDYSTMVEDAIIFLPKEAYTLKVCSWGTIACKTASIKFKYENIPSYWVSYLNSKIESINTKASTNGVNGDAFVFITDIHWDSFNFQNSPALIKYILKQTSISNVFCGGDIAQDSTLAEERGFMDKIREAKRFFPTPGNHDVSANGWYSVFMKPLEDIIDTNKKAYFVLDNQSQKIRYIFLETRSATSTLSAEQIAFLNAKTSILDSAWTIVIITHIIWEAALTSESTLPLTTCGSSVMGAVDDAAENTEATIAAIICGHCHRDYDGQTPGGIPVIATTCDANGAQVYDPITPTRTAGTTTEQAFDVFSIDTSAKKIYTTRIGGNGADREFSY